MRRLIICVLSMSALLAAEARVAGSDAPMSRPVDPPSGEAVAAAIERGVGFLVRVQNPDGSWGSARRPKDLNIYAPVPGAHHAFRAAVTSLCIAALIEAGGGSPSPAVAGALDRGEAWLIEHLPELRRADAPAIYNVWGHAYAIQALVRMLRRHACDEAAAARICGLIRGQIGMLERYESVDGGWGYYDFEVGAKQPAGSSLSFVNAAALVALHEARRAGIEPPPRLVERAVAATLRQRTPDFGYVYGEYLKYRPRHPVNRPGGSLGRSQACNVALRLWGDAAVTDAVLQEWLGRLFARNGWLDMGRKRPIPHESWFQVAGYFFYFGHYYAALCIGELAPPARAPFQDRLAGVLLALQETDGSWWDYPLYDYHQQYGTAYALMSLMRCVRERSDGSD